MDTGDCYWCQTQEWYGDIYVFEVAQFLFDYNQRASAFVSLSLGSIDHHKMDVVCKVVEE